MKVNFEKIKNKHRLSYEEYQEFKKNKRKGYKTKDVVFNKRDY